MLSIAQGLLWDGCENYLELSIAIGILSLKNDYNMPKGCFICMVQIMGDALASSNCMSTNLYRAKKSMEKLGLCV